jgi:hypothetical protein
VTSDLHTTFHPRAFNGEQASGLWVLTVVDLTWSGNDGGMVDIFRDGSWIAGVTGNYYSDSLGSRKAIAGSEFVYSICAWWECSDEVRVSF